MKNHDYQLPGEIEISELTEADFNEFQDIELLELLLGLFTNSEHSQGLSRICYRRFGSLPNLVGTSSQTLHQAGLSWRVILTIKIIKALSGRINNQVGKTPVIDKDQLAINKN